MSADLAISAGGRTLAVSTARDGTLDGWRGDVGGTLALSGLPAPGASGRIDPDEGSAGARVAVGDARREVMAWVAAGRIVASARGLDGVISPGTPIFERGVPGTSTPALAIAPRAPRSRFGPAW